MDLTAIRSQFSHVAKCIFMNHAGHSPVSKPVIDAMTAHLADVAENAMGNEPQWARREAELRANLGRVLNCGSSEIAFVKNTSEGISLAASGIDWQPGDNVIISDVEFPANVYAWLALERKGVEVRYVREGEGRIVAEDLFALVDGRTRAVSLSLVEYASGFRVPAEEIGAFCRERDILFVLDAFQAVGALKVDVQALNVDVIASASQKWLMGPDGFGYMYVRKEAMDRIAVTEWGWRNVTTSFTSFDYKLEERPDAMRYECGTINTTGMYGCAAAVELYLASGVDAVEERVIALTDYLCDQLSAAGFRILSPRGPGEKSGIVCFEHPTRPVDELGKALFGANVVCTVRNGRVRLAPHYYNTEAEADAVIRVLTKGNA